MNVMAECCQNPQVVDQVVSQQVLSKCIRKVGNDVDTEGRRVGEAADTGETIIVNNNVSLVGGTRTERGMCSLFDGMKMRVDFGDSKVLLDRVSLECETTHF